MQNMIRFYIIHTFKEASCTQLTRKLLRLLTQEKMSVKVIESPLPVTIILLFYSQTVKKYLFFPFFLLILTMPWTLFLFIRDHHVVEPNFQLPSDLTSPHSLFLKDWPAFSFLYVIVETAKMNS